MSDVVLSRNEYSVLRARAEAFDRLLFALRSDAFSPPPIKSRKEILRQFKNPSRYNAKFLESLKRGLERSIYFEE